MIKWPKNNFLGWQPGWNTYKGIKYWYWISCQLVPRGVIVNCNISFGPLTKCVQLKPSRPTRLWECPAACAPICPGSLVSGADAAPSCTHISLHFLSLRHFISFCFFVCLVFVLSFFLSFIHSFILSAFCPSVCVSLSLSISLSAFTDVCLPALSPFPTLCSGRRAWEGRQVA